MLSKIENYTSFSCSEIFKPTLIVGDSMILQNMLQNIVIDSIYYCNIRSPTSTFLRWNSLLTEVFILFLSGSSKSSPPLKDDNFSKCTIHGTGLRVH